MPLRTCNLPQVTIHTCIPCSSILHNHSLRSTLLPLSPCPVQCLLLVLYQTSKEVILAPTTCLIPAYVLNAITPILLLTRAAGACEELWCCPRHRVRP